MTKSRLQLLALICGVLTIPGVAAAQLGDAGAYLRLDGGANFAENLSLAVDGEDGEMQLEPGFRVDLAAGYDINKWAAIELEVGYFQNSAESVRLLDQSAHLDDTWLHGVPVLANFRLQYRNRTDFVPYIGVGAGGLVSMLSINGDSDTKILFAYQISAGFIYLLDERGWLDFGYKFFGAGDSDYAIGIADVEASKIRSHFIGASVIWRL